MPMLSMRSVAPPGRAGRVALYPIVLCLVLGVAAGMAFAQQPAGTPAAPSAAAPATRPAAPPAVSAPAASPPTAAPLAAPSPNGAAVAPNAPRSVPAAAPVATQPSPSAQPAAPGPAPGTVAPGTPAAAPPVAGPDGGTPVAAPDGSGLPTDAPLPDALPPAANATLPHNLSPWGMFMAADLVVKAVMIGLAFASVVTWTVWLVKTLELWAANRAVRRTLKLLRQGSGLVAIANELQKRGGAAAALVRATLAEVEASRSLPAEGIKERVAVSLNRIEAAAARRMVIGTGLLATIGATAPFVGLFGTVWGIMNSFIGISKAQTTNLAVVAPGIAEALLATAIGLVAAIPAVIIYNVFARAIANYKASLADASAEAMRHLSRDLDRNQAGIVARLRPAAE
ncbi:tonB-system energizer ExbB [Aquabacter spiritensis]|uniref:Biopolymer transport protein ExbB n=1 Tax=Aquabacter spiritensis TaxID=933073 RepID=A0A4R3LSL3_9HYPH|nr:tonB-system energizer ExbB [Aquabacter spiritensis]TCT03490.1 outer membrane transport energization protein ExbB [Aquabacter spiritensis]